MTMRSLSPGDVSGQFALDARALAGLKQQAKAAPGEALRAAAGQFEALFMQMLLKSMREALPKDGPFASETTRTYTTMFDQQISQQLAKKGMGLADMLVKQLSASVGATGAADAKNAAPAAPPSRAKPVPKSGPATLTFESPAARPARAASHTTDFIARLLPHAQAAAKAAGIPVAFLLAQAALETGWGRQQPRSADGTSSHNLFGIKAGSRWKGETVVAATTEYVAGRAVTAMEAFRSYASYTEAFRDFANLIRGNPRYAGAIASTHDAGTYARSLQKAGYATDPHYADKLARTIQTVTRLTQGGAAQVAANAADKPTGAA